MLIVDAGPLVAAALSRTDEHRACRDLLQSHPGPLIVPEPVLCEAAYLLGRRLGAKAEAIFARSIAKRELTVEPMATDEWGRVAELVETYADLPLGIVDASVVTLCERFGETKLATLDRRHFSVVRPRHCETFELLPRLG